MTTVRECSLAITNGTVAGIKVSLMGDTESGTTKMALRGKLDRKVAEEGGCSCGWLAKAMGKSRIRRK